MTDKDNKLKSSITSRTGYEQQFPDDFQELFDKEEASDYNLHVHRKFTVDPGQTSMRIDQFLPHLLQRVSRSRVKRAADHEMLRVNGNAVKASYKVRPGDEIELLLPYPPPPDLRPENIPVDILYEDTEFLIINKPAGMVVHPGIGNWTGTLVQALLYYLNQPAENIREEPLLWPGLVHRIDKDTSGLLVVAKTEEALFILSNQFYRHRTRREYWAVVWGNVKNDSGTISANVGRDEKDRKRYAVIADGSSGKYAITHYEVIERFGFATLLRCKLETGRTHQIRVHLKFLGHPLFADSIYGGDKIPAGNANSNKFRLFIRKCMQVMRRQALHARTLGFTHPSTGKEVYFEIGAPEDFQDLLKLFRSWNEEGGES